MSFQDTGGSLVLSPADRTRVLDGVKTTVKDVEFRNLSPEESSQLATTVIRTCLKKEPRESTASKNSRPIPRHFQPRVSSSARTGRLPSCLPPCGTALQLAAAQHRRGDEVESRR